MTSSYAEQKRKYWGAPTPPGIKHGSDTYAAKVYGCDCRACLPSGRRRAAKGHGADRNTRMKRYRASRQGKPVPEHIKHGISTYITFRCRCEVCRAAKSEQNQRTKRRRAELALAPRTEAVEVTIVHWPPVGEGQWTCPECGESFRMRRKIQHAAAA